MTHSKAKLRSLSREKMIGLISFLLSYLAATNPKAYHAAERAAGLEGRSGARRRGKGKVAKGGGEKRRKMSAAQKRNAMKFKRFVKKHGRGPRKGEHL